MHSGTERHIASLDGLRGVAILAVIADHACGGSAASSSILARGVFDVSRLGYGGVDLFFVLSGFLITRSLLRTRNAINFYRAFYWRRLLRIAPVYYLALILVFFVGPVVTHAQHTPAAVQLVFWFNVSNFWTPYHAWTLPVLGAFWSLAIEEQFYLIWPSVVRRVTSRVLLSCRPVSIAKVCLAVRCWRSSMPSGELHRWERLFRWSAVPCVVAFSYCVTHSWRDAHLDLTFVALACTAIVGLCLTPGALTTLFSARLLRPLAAYSYFMYVFHLMVMLALQRRVRPLNHPFAYELLIAALTVAITFGFGAISYRYFETPILSRKKLVPYRPSAETYA